MVNGMTEWNVLYDIFLSFLILISYVFIMIARLGGLSWSVASDCCLHICIVLFTSYNTITAASSQ